MRTSIFIATNQLSAHGVVDDYHRDEGKEEREKKKNKEKYTTRTCQCLVTWSLHAYTCAMCLLCTMERKRGEGTCVCQFIGFRFRISAGVLEDHRISRTLSLSLIVHTETCFGKQLREMQHRMLTHTYVHSIILSIMGANTEDSCSLGSLWRSGLPYRNQTSGGFLGDPPVVDKHDPRISPLSSFVSPFSLSLSLSLSLSHSLFLSLSPRVSSRLFAREQSVTNFFLLYFFFSSNNQAFSDREANFFRERKDSFLVQPQVRPGFYLRSNLFEKRKDSLLFSSFFFVVHSSEISLKIIGR